MVGLRLDRIYAAAFVDTLDYIEGAWIDWSAEVENIEKGYVQMQADADEALTDADDFGMTAAAEAGQDAMMETFGPSLSEEQLLALERERAMPHD